MYKEALDQTKLTHQSWPVILTNKAVIRHSSQQHEGYREEILWGWIRHNGNTRQEDRHENYEYHNGRRNLQLDCYVSSKTTMKTNLVRSASILFRSSHNKERHHGRAVSYPNQEAGELDELNNVTRYYVKVSNHSLKEEIRLLSSQLREKYLTCISTAGTGVKRL